MSSEFDRLPDFEPSRLGSTPAANPVQEFLDERGLPWRESMADLARRFGVRPHPSYDWDVVLLDPESMRLPGRLFPLAANATRLGAPFPPDYFFTHVWVGDDPLANIECAAAAISTRLGAAPVGRRWNTLMCEWVAGPASIRLTGYPPSLQTLQSSNPSHDRDPRLKTACHVSVYPGFRPPLAEHERVWIATATEVSRIRGAHVAESVAALDRARPSPLAVEFARNPVAECGGFLGKIALSGDGKALIVCGAELLVIPLERVVRVNVSKMTRAKGPGGSWVSLACIDDADASKEKNIQVSGGSGPDDLDAFAQRLARRIGKPVEIEAAQPDM